MSVVGGPLPSGGGDALLRGLSDDQLAALWAAGDMRGIGTLAERWVPALERYCERIVHDHQLAQDAVQDALVGALRGVGKRRRADGVRQWLFAIARNAALDVRAAGARGAGAASAEPVSAVDLHERVVLRDWLRTLVDDLGELPRRQRDALRMRAFERLPYERIGTRLGISAAAAERAARAARMSLLLTAAGREMPCIEVREALANPGRGRRPASLRAHLRACENCRDAVGSHRLST